MSNNEYKNRVMEATKHFYKSRSSSRNRPEKKKNIQAGVKIFTESLFSGKKQANQLIMYQLIERI